MDPMPVHLSSAREASLRCMLPLVCIYEFHIQARLFNEEGQLISESGPVSMRDDDWMCLTSDVASGCNGSPTYRLLSLVRECPNGWAFCFDVKERSDSVSVLTYVRVVQCAGPLADEPEDGSHTHKLPACAGKQPPHEDVFDCTELDCSGLHPTHSALLQLFRQPDGQLLDPLFWTSLSPASATATPDRSLLSGLLQASDHELKACYSELGAAGYSRLRQLLWHTIGISVQALAETMDCLEAKGFPPVFIFMYDQAWLLLAQLFRIAADILKSNVVEMSLNVFAWALHSAAPDRRVGSNFGQPHRDQSYRDCHAEDGHLSMMTVWVSLVPVTLDNGCMYVLPSDRDPWLAQADHPLHVRPDEQAVRPLGEPLPCEAGDVLMWRADLVHWGSACQATATQPRKSLATMFLRPGAGQRNTITAEELRAGLSMDARLRIVARTLLQYKSWYPDFAGLCLEGQPAPGA